MGVDEILWQGQPKDCNSNQLRFWKFLKEIIITDCIKSVWFTRCQH